MMEEQIARLLPDWTWRRPGGGLSLWVRLPRGNGAEFARVALRPRGLGPAGRDLFAVERMLGILEAPLRARAGEDPRRHPAAGARLECLRSGRAHASAPALEVLV